VAQGEGARPLLRKKFNSNYNNILFLSRLQMPTGLFIALAMLTLNAHPQSLGPTLLKFTHFFGCYLMCILLSPSGDYVWRISA